MNKGSKTISCIVIVTVLLLCVVFGVGLYELFFDNTVILRVDGLDGEIRIEEWRTLHNAGANVYYCKGRERILLGGIDEGDGYGLPDVKDKMFSAAIDGDLLTLRWDAFSGILETDWKEKTFILPQG